MNHLMKFSHLNENKKDFLNLKRPFELSWKDDSNNYNLIVGPTINENIYRVISGYNNRKKSLFCPIITDDGYMEVKIGDMIQINFQKLKEHSLNKLSIRYDNILYGINRCAKCFVKNV